MQEVCAHTKVCLARLSECLRRVFGPRRDLAQGVLRRRYSGVVENVMAVHRDAVRRDVLVPKRCRDGLDPEPRVENPATADLGQLPKERQNFLEIVDPRAFRWSIYRRLALQPDDEPAVRQSTPERCQTLRVAQM
jgi:hypothetical protein